VPTVRRDAVLALALLDPPVGNTVSMARASCGRQPSGSGVTLAPDRVARLMRQLEIREVHRSKMVRTNSPAEQATLNSDPVPSPAG
jgi:hypothetical protein